MKLQRLQTTNLFYNKYVYKLRIKNTVGSIFRGMNLGFAKAKLDEMQSQAEAGMQIKSPFWRPKNNKYITLETFMDAYTLYSSLEANKDRCMVRIENNIIDLYSNSSDWLEDIAKKIYAVSIHEPKTDDALNYLLENKNTVIQSGEVKWPYKAILGKSVDPNFATYVEKNADNIKMGLRALNSVRKKHNTEGYYFFTKDEKHLLLAKIAIGGSISKIVKYLSDKELHK